MEKRYWEKGLDIMIFEWFDSYEGLYKLRQCFREDGEADAGDHFF